MTLKSWSDPHLSLSLSLSPVLSPHPIFPPPPLFAIYLSFERLLEARPAMPIRPSSSIALSNWALCSSRLLIVLRENEPPSTTLSPVLSPQTSFQAQFVYIDRDGELGGEWDGERGGGRREGECSGGEEAGALLSRTHSDHELTQVEIMLLCFSRIGFWCFTDELTPEREGWGWCGCEWGVNKGCWELIS
ncbi:hypothetical protein Prudu_108S000400 [Prunus dulcis]|uniref:Uncharacterized protein n=1 Tax=Prunus dulcis TaxID=3755 RepID=A0A5H2XM82_PRUDU|nr:hypothetical protein Prudu_108S000400 [Prunus dulcis]